MPSSINLPGCSFNRAKYSKPEDVLNLELRPEFTGIAALKTGDVPKGSVKDGDRSIEYFFVNHAPEKDNWAHAEVRVKKAGAEYNKNLRINDPEVALRIKQSLAETLKVLKEPV